MSNNDKYASFNPGQRKAVLETSKKDILIAAGAGSGKTKVLSERVYRLMEDKEIKPSELLVLTFTNNAAHEMKTRIVSLFKKQGSSLSDEMLSAHIQTFDSFSQYLVSTYSGRLGIASTISLADDTVIEAKRMEILEQIMGEWYEDDAKCARLVNLAKKIGVRGDSEITKIVIDLDAQLSKMMEGNKKKFIETYDEAYCSDEKYYELLEEYLDEFRLKMIESIYKASFIKNNSNLLLDPIENKEEINALFEDKKFFETKYDSFDFSEHARLQNIADAVKNLIAKKGEDFIKDAKKDAENKDLLTAPSQKNWKITGEEVSRLKPIFEPLRLVYATQKSILYPVLQMNSDLEKDKEEFKSIKEDIHVLFELVLEMERRLFEYEKSINSFTFSDVSTLALRLVVDERYKDIAQEIRSRFKYVMVDEYQDTNDFQEAFINSLLTPDENGERAHVFCVGDAKQSIYGFRNSNVELFRARQKLYETDGEGEVIAMNTNYRSGKNLLAQINEIFKCYMSVDHGSIDYTVDMEQLKYDDGVDLYGLPYEDFNIVRIHGLDTKTKEGEIGAIIHDIKEKVANHFQVYEKGIPGKLRDCRYGDFAILTRTKKFYGLYQDAFNKAGIPLNLSVLTNLREIDSVIAVESLLRFYMYFVDGSGDPLHHFASIARSYLYSYDDDRLYQIISDPSLAKLKEDPIYKKMEEFHERKKNESLSLLYLSLVEEFGVLSKLHLVGSVNDATSKIESLYVYVTKIEAAGEGIESFLRLFNNISKYDLGFDAESEFEVENSVDLMTIHASKGLERKIVYLPNSENHMSGGDARRKPSYGFSCDTGIVLPRYFPNLDENGEVVDTHVKDTRYLAFDKKSSEKEEINEHVRLFYVALTRAENAIYIVGEPSIAKEDLYEMLNSMPHAEKFNDSFIQKAILQGCDIGTQYRCYLDLCEHLSEKRAAFSKDDFVSPYSFDVYSSLYNKFHVDPIEGQINELYKFITTTIYRFYVNQITDYDPDSLAWLFAAYLGYYFDEEVTSIENLADQYDSWAYGEYLKCLKEIDEAVLSGEISEQEGEEEKAEMLPPEPLDRALLREKATMFAMCFERQDTYSFTGHEPSKEGIKKYGEEMAKDILMAPVFLRLFAETKEGEGWVSQVSYASPNYPDVNYEYRANQYQPNVSDDMPPMVDTPLGDRLNDDEIVFEPRVKKRASKGGKLLTDVDNVVRNKFDFGERLHRYMELYDFKKKDLSYISDPHDKALIQRAVNSDLLKSLEGYEFMKEYGYYDEDLKTTGFIDLLAIKDGHYVIVDYKTKNIDDSAYEHQLHAYQRNVMRLFNVDKDNISLYLLSLIGTDDKEIEVE